MAREASGELKTRADGFAARITVEGRDRRDFALTTCRTEAEAVERCKALAGMAARLRRAGQVDQIVPISTMGAKARAGRPWDAVVQAVDVLCAGAARDRNAPEVPTVADFCDEWTSGRLHARYADHVTKKKPSSVTRDEGIVGKYIKPVLDGVRMNEVTLAHCEAVMANVPAGLSPSSRRHVAQALCKVLAYAVYPCRYLSASPVPKGWLPKGGKPKAMQCVRPTEDAAHLANTSLPLWRRLFFGVDRREGLRVEELASLRMRDLDLKLGLVRLDVNKTSSPRAWALAPDVAEALRRYVAKYRPGTGPDDHLIVDETTYRIDCLRLAAQQRADLKTSGVTRVELHEDGTNRRKLRAHDARASFVTEALARGKSEAWLMDRGGWTTSAMLNRYRRASRTWGELNLGTWTPLHEAIPELREEALPQPIAPAIVRGPSGIAPSIAPGNDSGAVAKWSGSGLQIRYTSVRIRSAPPRRIPARCAPRWRPAEREEGRRSHLQSAPLKDDEIEAAIVSVTRALADHRRPRGRRGPSSSNERPCAPSSRGHPWGGVEPLAWAGDFEPWTAARTDPTIERRHPHVDEDGEQDRRGSRRDSRGGGSRRGVRARGAPRGRGDPPARGDRNHGAGHAELLRLGLERSDGCDRGDGDKRVRP